MIEIIKFLLLFGLVQLCWTQTPPICDSAESAENCANVWFSCAQTGTATVTGLGVEFSQFQPVTRWKISNPRFDHLKRQFIFLAHGDPPRILIPSF
jgi:hypothetical protein